MERTPMEVTRQDRIYCLKASSDYHSEVCEECKAYPNCDHMTQDDMTELTIKDLEVLERQPSEDCVSREEVLKQIKEWRDCEFVKMTNPYHYLEKRIQSMSPVTPARPKGYWIDHSDEGYVECSNCGSATNCDDNISDLHFCFSCGAKMDSEVEE